MSEICKKYRKKRIIAFFKKHLLKNVGNTLAISHEKILISNNDLCNN